MTLVASPPRVATSRRNPILRLFTSIWFGIVLLALIFIYSSVISAYAPARWATEMTEMQAFRHWFFVLLVALFALCLIAVTLFRTRWRLINLGSLLSHLGLLLITGGAVAYFSTKVEGDVLLRSPAIEVRANMGMRPTLVARLPAAAGQTWVPALPPEMPTVVVKVLDTAPRGAQPAATARLSVALGDAPAQVVELAANGTAWTPLTGMLEMRLVSPPPQNAFYDDERPVLYLHGPVGGEIVKPIEHLPIHRERYLMTDGVLRDVSGRDVPSRRTDNRYRVLGVPVPAGWFESWRMPIEVESEGLPFTVTVTGYVPAVLGLQPLQLPDGRTAAGEPVLELAENRRPGIGRSMSAIRLKLTGRGPAAGWSESHWCLYSPYPDFEARPLEIALPGDAGNWTITYSRARHDLGASVAARRLYVKYQPGQRNVDTFHSEVLLQDAEGQPRPVSVSTNETQRVGHWTLYQSGFDGQQHWTYSVLGVGNRIGLWPMNIGWIVLTVGCLFAFYVKPVLLRRQKERGLSGRPAGS